MMPRWSRSTLVQICFVLVQLLFRQVPLVAGRPLPLGSNRLAADPAYPNYYSNNVSTPSSLGVIVPVVLFAVLLSTVIGTCIYETFIERGRININGPEVQSNLVLCHDENAEYEYKLVLRVGCPTANFDMKNGYIDVTVLGPGDQAQGQPVRFKCARLPDRVCGEMHLEIVRMTQMPEIAGILLNHGDRFGSIFLYETILIELGDNKVVETRRFNTYLTDRPTIYRGKKCNANEPDDGLYPELPLLEWTKFERAILATFFVMVIGSLTLLIEYFNLYPTNQKQDGSMIRSLLNVIFLLPLALPLLAAVTILYKFYFKRNVTTQEYAISPSNTLSWSLVCKVFLGFLLAVALTLFSVFVYFGLAISWIKSIYWWCSTLLTSVFVFGTWALANKCLSLFESGANKNLANLPNFSSSQVLQTGDNDAPQRTMFFTKIIPNNSTKTSDRMSSASCVGPKLYNPRSKGKVSKVKKVAKGAKVSRTKITASTRKRKQTRVHIKSLTSTNTNKTRHSQRSRYSRGSKNSKHGSSHNKKSASKNRIKKGK